MTDMNMPAAVREGTGLMVPAGEIQAAISRAGETLTAMADMVRMTNRRMEAMEEEMRALREAVRTMEKVTPEQAKTIGRLIQQRAKDLCEEYRIAPAGTDRAEESEKKRAGRPGLSAAEKAIGNMIRADVREMTGVRADREIARCDWETVVDFVTEWDDYEKIQKIKRGIKK